MQGANGIREQAYNEVVQGLKGHPSKVEHPAVESFAAAVADRLAQFACLQDGLKESSDKLFPNGSSQRNRAATMATIKLAHTLQKMSPSELDYFVPPAETVVNFRGMDIGEVTTEGLSEWLDAVPRWAHMTIAIAEVLKLRQAVPPVRKRAYGKVRANRYGYILACQRLA